MQNNGLRGYGIMNEVGTKNEAMSEAMNEAETCRVLEVFRVRRRGR